MIRINLLGTERKQAARKAPSFDVGQRLTVACSLILVGAFVGIGWWYWSLNNEAARLDAEIVARQQEAARLQSLLVEVQQFEAQRAQLQQRVQLIEQLRSGQSVPVQLLDHVSRSLPDMMWLTDMTQEGGGRHHRGPEHHAHRAVRFRWQSRQHAALLKKPIEIVNSQVESARRTGGTPGAAACGVDQFHGQGGTGVQRTNRRCRSGAGGGARCAAAGGEVAA